MMHRRPTSGASTHRGRGGDDNARLRQFISRGAGEWSAVPECVRDAIAELLERGNSSRPIASSEKPRRQPTIAQQQPRRVQASTAAEASKRRVVGQNSSMIVPLVHLNDDALLMSVRSFEDAEVLRQHAVRNAAQFHNNVEQTFRDMRLCLVPELRAAIQLHPLALEELREQHGNGSSGNHGAYVSGAARSRITFEDALLTDVVDAIDRLRAASVRFTANFFSDDEKAGLGIDPHTLPRENERSGATQRTPSSRSAHDHHSLLVDSAPSSARQPTRALDAQRRGWVVGEAVDTPASANQSFDHGMPSLHHEEDDQMALEEEDEPPGDRSPRRMGRGGVEVQSCIPEEEEAPGDRSPRRHRDLPAPPSPHAEHTHRPGHYRSNEGRRPRVAGPDALINKSTDDESEPVIVLPVETHSRVDVHARHHNEVKQLRVETTPSRVLNMDAASASRTRQSSGGETLTMYAPPPPLSTSPQDRRRFLPPTSPSTFVAQSLDSTTQHNEDTRLVRSPPMVNLSPRSFGRSPSEGDRDNSPYDVAPPGTPKTRNDFVIHAAPRPISVKKKTVLIPRSSSVDRSSVASTGATPPRSPSNSMRRKQGGLSSRFHPLLTSVEGGLSSGGESPNRVSFAPTTTSAQPRGNSDSDRASVRW